MTDVFEHLKTALSDRYAIEREIGSGGMATVYVAEDLKLHRKVALKVLRPELAATLGPDRFLQEIDIAAKLTHPHILGLHDCGEADGFLYFVMPYVEGQSLRERLAKEGELPIAEAVNVLRDIVDALSHAHQQNVVHRDIKPDNVMLTGRHALVTDFGVAKAVSEATGRQQMTTEGVALGTPAYMAPEQAAADPLIDHRADIYAVGAVAYELLTGRPPFTGTTQQQILAAQVTEAPEPVTKHRATVPQALEQLVSKCLEKKAADRWQSAEELLPQLDALATPSGGTTPVTSAPANVPKQSRKKAVIAATVAATIVMILAITFFPRRGGITLDPDRVVVAEFRNETGDPTLDEVGRMAGHWITRGLQQTGLVNVVPWETALQSGRYVQSENHEGRMADPVRGLAEETGAAIVISGAYYLDSDSVQLQADINNAVDGNLLGALEPVVGPRESPSSALSLLQQNVMGLLAVRFDERLAATPSVADDPPPFEAYQAFSAGLDEYVRAGGAVSTAAQQHFRRAFGIDSTWAEALLFLTLTHWNAREYVQIDSLMNQMEVLSNRLTPYFRGYMQYIQGLVHGDQELALSAIRSSAEMAPGSRAWYNLGQILYWTNRPREAISAFLTLDPDRGAMRGWLPYLALLSAAYLNAGDYANALAVARRARVEFGETPTRLAREAYAATGLGRIDEVEALVDAIFALPEQGLDQARSVRNIAVYLHRNGHVDAAQRTLDRSLQWYEARHPSSRATAEWIYPNYAPALYVAGRCDDAVDAIRPLVNGSPENVTYRGFLGMAAACSGDIEEAQGMSQWLADLDRPYLRGTNTFWRSAIAAELDDAENAVFLVRQAQQEGLRRWATGDARWVAFESIYEHPEFQEFIRPTR